MRDTTTGKICNGIKPVKVIYEDPWEASFYAGQKPDPYDSAPVCEIQKMKGE